MGDDFSTPHPALRATLCLRERDSRLQAFPDGKGSSVAANGLELGGTRGARRGNANLQHAVFEFINALLRFALVCSGRIDVIDDLWRLRSIGSELHFHHDL